MEACRKGFYSVGKQLILRHNLVDLLRQLSRAFDNVCFLFSLLLRDHFCSFIFCLSKLKNALTYDNLLILLLISLLVLQMILSLMLYLMVFSCYARIIYGRVVCLSVNLKSCWSFVMVVLII